LAQRIYRIHPAIGIARVGNADRPANSDAGYFVGPEKPGIPADPSAPGFKDAADEVRSQAARFRIFEYERAADGTLGLGREVSLNDGRTQSIEWTVELANRKASFFNFQGQSGANDLFATRPTGDRRNQLVKPGSATPAALAERARLLDLAPGPQKISGANGGGKKFSINRPPLKIDTLGELRTDASGCLLVLGGKGKSDRDPNLPWSHSAPAGQLQDYANNDQWFDDVSDGPVSAEIKIEGQTHKAEGAWVVVGPPDFAPHLRGYRTLYDTICDVMVRNITFPKEAVYAGALKHLQQMQADWNAATNSLTSFKPSFTRDIYPILAPMFRVWRVFDRRVSPSAADRNFHGILDPSLFATIGGPGSDADLRTTILQKIRDPKLTANPVPGNPPDMTKMPNTFGDFYDRNGHPGSFHSVSLLQHALLTRWEQGQFVEDWAGPPAATNTITPEGLDQAALENAVGGAFYPGIEASWLVQKPAVYASPFRFARDKVIASTTVGDLAITAGFFSRQMALPWQADFMECSKDQASSGAQHRQFAWWPTQRPDDVFPDFDRTKRRPWARSADGSPFGGKEDMTKNWWTLGFIVEKDGDLFETEGPRPPSA
jgi:hypothetical protein